MNPIPSTETRLGAGLPASETPSSKNDGQKSPKGKIKNWIKKLPFFAEADYLRRKIYDSPIFDFTVKSLADTLEEWPRSLMIDNTNRCNAKCVWCPNPDLTNLGLMKMPLYKKIVDDYAQRGGYICFGTFGEPLLDSTFAEKIEYTRRFASIPRVEVLTNAYFLNKRVVPTLLENSVGVEISLDELDKKTFEDVKKMSYDVVRENIINFLEANDRLPKPVVVNFRIKTLKTMEETLNHELFKKINDHQCTVILTPIDDNIITNWAGRFDKDTFFEQHGINSENVRYNHKQFNKANKAPCNQLWRWMVIYWDGSVVLCCVDMFSSTVVGNLRENTIEEIWNGPILTELREKMVQRKRFEIPICKNCDLHLSWHNLKTYYNHPGTADSIYKDDVLFYG
ncbi:MAG: radical SAM/SPASM domain-containing protein [Nitrospinota bacterium]|nr:radical SAM/SPASM domain-containing protein [Nitrospinota bacterium]